MKEIIDYKKFNKIKCFEWWVGCSNLIDIILWERASTKDQQMSFFNAPKWNVINVDSYVCIRIMLNIRDRLVECINII